MSSEQTKLNITTRRSAYPQKLFGSSKIDLQFTQRTVREPSLSEYDQCLRKGLEVILNINLSESQWLQSTLPIGMGGLGIGRVSSLALPAFLASAAGTLELQSNLLKELGSHPDPNMEKLLAMWQAELGINITVDFPTHIQSKWDQ